MKNIQDYLNNLVENQKTPSVQYTFFDYDTRIFEYSAGVRNVKLREEVDRSSTYNLFSITKTFTALSVFQLVEKGKINLDDNISRYLRDFPYQNISIRQLLNHSAGIANPLPLNWVHLQNEHPEFDAGMFFTRIAKKYTRLRSIPGSRFNYSNLGYLFLGALVEKIEQLTFESYVTENIVAKIGLEPSSLGFSIDRSTHATGYHKWLSFSNLLLGFLIDKNSLMLPNEDSWQPFRNFYVNGSAYGGLIGSRKGLVRYGAALLKEDSLLLNKDLRKVFFSENLINNKGTGMANSWFTGNLKGNKYLTHAGGGGGYYTELRLYPALGVGSVIMLNRSGFRDERILDKTDAFFISQQISR
jgi:D-alanyl-D-alanine carboxypeptidase